MVAPLRAKCIALRRTRLTPLIRAPLSARPGAFPDVARVNRNVPAVPVFIFQGAGEIMSATAPASQSVLTEQYSIPAHCGFVNCPPAVPFFQCARC